MSALKICLTTVLAFSFLSVLSLALLWRGQVTTQLRLDRCIQKTALALRDLQNQLEKSNLRIKFERKALTAAMLTTPETVPVIQALIETEFTLQTGLMASWNFHQISWISHRGCDSKSDYFFPLPALGWVRPPPDILGIRPLERQNLNHDGLSIRLWHPPRRSSAMVKRGTRNWSARYARF